MSRSIVRRTMSVAAIAACAAGGLVIAYATSPSTGATTVPTEETVPTYEIAPPPAPGTPPITTSAHTIAHPYAGSTSNRELVARVIASDALLSELIGGRQGVRVVYAYGTPDGKELTANVVVPPLTGSGWMPDQIFTPSGKLAGRRWLHLRMHGETQLEVWITTKTHQIVGLAPGGNMGVRTTSVWSHMHPSAPQRDVRVSRPASKDVA